MKHLVVLSKPLAWLKLLRPGKVQGEHGEPIHKAETLSSDNDFLYMVRFRTYLVPNLYQLHIVTDYACCIFCCFLNKSHCHSNCFYCSKGIYSTCDTLLPGPSSFSSDMDSCMEATTWFFKPPCRDFKRLVENEYTQNLDYGGFKDVIINYETIQSLFFGICNGNRPCHICATVNLHTFLQCPEAGNPMNGKKPCDIILKRLSSVCKRQPR